MHAVPELPSNLSLMISKGACRILFYVVFMDVHLEWLEFLNWWGVFVQMCNSSILGQFLFIFHSEIRNDLETTCLRHIGLRKINEKQWLSCCKQPWHSDYFKLYTTKRDNTSEVVILYWNYPQQMPLTVGRKPKLKDNQNFVTQCVSGMLC